MLRTPSILTKKVITVVQIFKLEVPTQFFKELSKMVKSCCGLGDIRAGARNIAIISMLYDLLMMAALLLILLLHVPHLPWKEHPETKVENEEISIKLIFYQILLIITISIRSIHLIPSFLLLYSTWEEIPRGVSFWLFMGVLDVILHLTWVGVPLLMKWPLDKTVILVSFVLLGVAVILYFIACINSYAAWIRDRHHDLRAKRHLKDYY
ncbi:unnamed protein product [Allacma fusca]|uniref:Uncharacterized protein n=1 Tax=Allacma fusca TaxID=39272 RepID=A0A8J2K3V1_9HEXA|nr:unnamed protein product [Allacma fusca]